MTPLILLCVCLALGLAAARLLRVPPGAPAAINFWLLNFALPALILVQVPRLQLDYSLLFPAIGPWVVMLGAMVFFPIIGKRAGWSRGTIGALILTCGLGNTVYLGLPLIEALRGREALGAAIIADQVGSFLALSTLGVVVAARYSGTHAHAAQVLLRVVTFPSFIALVIAVIVRAVGGWPPWSIEVLSRIGDTLTPLALFSVGLQFRFGDVAHHVPRVVAGLSWKLVLAPAVVAAMAWTLGMRGLEPTVTILQCAMAPMVTAGLLAEQHKLDPPLANAVVGLGLVVSLVSVPLWNVLL
jgi:predicted permease